MNQKIKLVLKSVFVFVLFALSFSALAVWINPISPPTGGNTNPPLNVGTTPQYKNANLMVDGFKAVSAALFTGITNFNGTTAFTSTNTFNANPSSSAGVIPTPVISVTNTNTAISKSTTALSVTGGPITGSDTALNSIAGYFKGGKQNSYSNSYGLYVEAGDWGNSGSAKNYAAYFGNGNVGIGTANPTQKLEVAGQVKITGGSPGAGKVLTSDATGVASWVTPSASSTVSQTPWTSNINAAGYSLTGAGSLSAGNLILSLSSQEGASVLLANPLKTGAAQAKEWKIFNMTGGYGNGLSFWRYLAGVGYPTVFFGDNGNVGINTSTPDHLLQVSGRAKATSWAVDSSNTDLVNNSPWYGLGTSNIVLSGVTSPAIQLAGYNGLIFKTALSQTSILPNGNLGVGTTLPTNLLTSNQSSYTTPSTASTYGIALNVSGSQQLTLGAGSAYTYLQSWNAKPLYINPQGNNVLFGNGSVGVGTVIPGTVGASSSIVTSGSRVLDIVGNYGQSTFLRVLGGQGATKGGLIIGNDDYGGVKNGTGNVGGRLDYGQFTFDNSNNTFTVNQNYPTGYLGLGAGGRGSDLTILATNGNIGMGTTTPRTKLEISGDGGVLATGTFGSGWTEPNIGAGTRMMWYPNKAAFRVGSVNGTQWNNAVIGNNSIAIGKNVISSGYASVALGESTTASDMNTTAMGFMTTASSSWSTAMGHLTVASGNASTAMGRYSAASGYASTAIGESTTASGEKSFAIGQTTKASGVRSVAMGYDTKAIGDTALAIGMSTQAIGSQSFAMGGNTEARGVDSFATGFRSVAIGNSSVAMGNTVTSGSYLQVSLGRNNVYQAGDPVNWKGNTWPVGSGDNSEAIFDIGIGDTEYKLKSALTVFKGGRVLLGATDGVESLSDRRLKENINYIDSGLSVIRQLKPATFDYIVGQKKQAGFIAQDVQQVLPDIVQVQVDGMLSITTQSIIPYLVKAAQEQDVVVKNQQDQIDLLKKEIEILKNK